MAAYGYGTGTGVRKAGSKWGGRKLNAEQKREVLERQIAYVRSEARRAFAKDRKASTWPWSVPMTRSQESQLAAWNDEMSKMEVV